MKAYRYRLYPEGETAKRFVVLLELCRCLYNWALAERRRHYKETGCSLTYRMQQDMLPSYKSEHSEFREPHSQVLQNVLQRVDEAFVNFFEGRARYPRFKRYGNCRSMTYPQADNTWIGKGSILLPKLGRVRMVKHRPIMGKVKTVTVFLTESGEWYACVIVENESRIVTKKPATTHNPVGVDTGLTNYLYLSDGSHVDNPKFIKRHQRRIVKAQRRLSRKHQIERTFTTANREGRTVGASSKNRLRARRILARRWQDYDNAKADWQWKLARWLVGKYDFIAYEDLPVENLMQNHNLAAAVQDAAWSSFWSKVEHEAAMAADPVTTLQRVPPQYTTQRCSRCGHLQAVALSERTYSCPNCGHIADRDHNASANILQLGIALSGVRTVVGMDVPEFTPVETGSLLPEAARPVTEASLVVEAGNKFCTRRRTPQSTGRNNAYGSPEASALGERHLVLSCLNVGVTRRVQSL